jgi:diguanylate cyclase (GGDEF)-like protein
VFALVSVMLPVAPRPLVSVPWWVLLLLFAAAQVSPLHVEVRKHSRSISLTELPFVVGLLAVGPFAFCAARVLAGVATELLVRRQHRQPVKLLFNAALFVGEALVGVATFRWLQAGHAASSPATWVAAVAAAIAASCLSCIAVNSLLEIVEGSRSVRAIGRVAWVGTLQSAAVANIGLVASLTLMANQWAVIPLVIAVAAFVIGYRAYGVVNERHARLQHLYAFSRAITGQTEPDDIVAGLLEQVAVILHAEGARLVRTGDDAEAADELHVQDGRLVRSEPQWLLDTDGWIRAHVVERGRGLLIRRGTTDLAGGDWLARNSLREAVFVPVAVDDRSPAVLVVADRMGDVRGFDDDDLELLETLTKQAAVELRNGQLMRRLRHDSLHDSVTGIPNRAALQQAVEQRLEACDTTVALGMIDLDAFKDVNDSFGHHSGDEMLTRVAARIIDAVGDSGDVCRFGGDEFAVALYGVTAARAAGFFRDLIHRLSEPIELEGTAIEVGASVGVALAPDQAITWPELVRKADVAMYAAKSAGRVVVVFEEALDGAGRSRLGLVAALHRAIDADELEVYVQPKAALADGTVVSTEALVRWTHPEMGVMPPADFIPLAERSGLIRELTAVVLDKAIAACADWQRVAANVGVAVNVSARCLQDDSLEAAVERSLRRHRLPASLLTLEITESSIMADPERTSGLLHRLRERGVRLSIDDFGTGYSSLSYLRRLPVSEIKIDRSFVARMRESADDAAIVQAVVELGHTLDLQVVAEGVEDDATWLLLRQAGCDIAQGYLLARPMPAAEFARWSAAHPNGVAPTGYDEGMNVRQLLPGPR